MFIVAKTQKDLSLAFLTRSGSYTKDPLDALRFTSRDKAEQRAGFTGTVIRAADACELPSFAEPTEYPTGSPSLHPEES